MTKCKDLKYERFCLEDFKAIVEPPIAAAEREKHSSVAGRIANRYNHLGNQSGGSLENWK